MSNHFQVVRPFQNLTVGTVIPGSEFVDSRRVAQLIEQRYIQPVANQDSGYQPSVDGLLSTPIRQLRLMIGDVKDAALLELAKLREVREMATQIYDKRIEELNGEVAHA